MSKLVTFTAKNINSSNYTEFDATSYSEFKYGLAAHGLRFAGELFQVFETELMNIETDYIVYSSPYQSIPTATYSMAFEFYTLLKHRMSDFGKSVKFEKLFRDPTYTVDYGTLNKEERLKLIGNDVFSFVKAPEPGYTLIFLDDVKVTGSHEHVLRNSLKTFSIENDCLLGYYAIVDADLPAHFEHEINERAIRGLKSISSLMSKDDFTFNTRVIKRILISPYQDFDHFLSIIGMEQLRQIQKLAHSNGYHEISDYKRNYSKLNEALNAL